MLWQGLKHALKCFALNFDKAVEIIHWDVNKTMCLTIIHKNVQENVFCKTIGWSNQ